MTLDQFAKLVAAMRSCQKDYFRTKSATALEASKAAERAVDKALVEIANKQKELFE